MARPIRNSLGVMDAIDRASMAFPELRVCQLIVNATGKSDPFYVEDNDLIRMLDEFVQKHAFSTPSDLGEKR